MSLKGFRLDESLKETKLLKKIDSNYFINLHVVCSLFIFMTFVISESVKSWTFLLLKLHYLNDTNNLHLIAFFSRKRQHCNWYKSGNEKQKIEKKFANGMFEWLWLKDSNIWERWIKFEKILEENYIVFLNCKILMEIWIKKTF